MTDDALVDMKHLSQSVNHTVSTVSSFIFLCFFFFFLWDDC